MCVKMYNERLNSLVSQNFTKWAISAIIHMHKSRGHQSSGARDGPAPGSHPLRAIATLIQSTTIVATCRKRITHDRETPTTRVCSGAGRSSIGVAGTPAHKCSRFLQTFVSDRYMSSAFRSLPRRRTLGSPIGRGVPQSAFDKHF